MLKILLFDHKFNCESISSLSLIDKSLEFYRYNSEYSIYDNYDLVKPDIILYNSYIYENIGRINCQCKIKQYNTEYLVPNNTTSHTSLLTSRKAVLITKNNELKSKQYKEIKYKNNYLPILSLEPVETLYHHQYIGYINSCKDLYNLIMSSELVLSTTNIIYSICESLNINYRHFKEDGATNKINGIDKSKIIDNKYILNNIIYE